MTFADKKLDEKKLSDQLAKDPVPVKCGDEFHVVVFAEVDLRLGCDGGPTDEEEREMQRLLEGEVLSETRFACERVGAICPKPQVLSTELVEHFCENDIWRQKLLVKIKCTA